jgi:hypothetical protein
MENRTFLAMADILAVRVECRACHATVVLDLDFFAKQPNAQVLAACPAHCLPEKSWRDTIAGESLGMERGIKHFIQSLNTIKADSRYILSFEIKQPSPAFALPLTSQSSS